MKYSSNEKKEVAVIIATWNVKHLLTNCLNALRDQTYSQHTVYLVENGSTDGTVDFIQKEYPEVHLLAQATNTGFAKGNNIGINKALKNEKNSYIALLNNDTIADPRWIEEMVNAIERKKDDGFGMIASKTTLQNGAIHNIGLACYKDLQGTLYGGISIGFGQNAEEFNKEIECFCPGGVAALFSRELLETTGGFDEDFFAYAEDLDLGFRGRLAGWRCLYAPKAKVMHLHSQTGGAASPFKAYYSKRNSYFVAIKNLPLRNLLQYPFLDIKWNVKIFFQKEKPQSVKKLQSTVGTPRMLLIAIKGYFGVLRYLPKMILKRRAVKKITTVSPETVQHWFAEFSRESTEKKIKAKTK